MRWKKEKVDYKKCKGGSKGRHVGEPLWDSLPEYRERPAWCSVQRWRMELRRRVRDAQLPHGTSFPPEPWNIITR